MSIPQMPHFLGRVTLCVALVLMLTSCDAYMAVTQPVEFSLFDKTRNRPAKSVTVAAVPRDVFSSTDCSESEWEEMVYPYDTVTVSDAGTGTACLSYTWIAGGLFADRDKTRDRVTGETYVFRIVSHDDQEYLAIPVMPGAQNEGTRFVLTLESISPPRKCP